MTLNIKAPARLLAYILLQGIAFTALAALIMSGSDLATSQSSEMASAPPDPAAALTPLLSLLAMVGAQGLALQLLMGRVKRALWPRMVLAFIVAFVSGTVLSQIDSIVFLEEFRSDLGIRIIAMGLFTSITAGLLSGPLFAPLAGEGTQLSLPHTLSGWAVALCAAALFHIVIYFVFGYWVVWVEPLAREFYDGAELLPFIEHMAGVLREMPWLVGVQFIRGLIWAGIAALVFWYARGSRIRLTLLVLVIFMGFGVAPLLVPNPLMPLALRQLHMLELALTAFAMAGAAFVLLRPWGRDRA